MRKTKIDGFTTNLHLNRKTKKRNTRTESQAGLIELIDGELINYY